MTSIFLAETSAKRYTWDKQSISHMHLRFSFFRIWAITIRSRENHVFPRLCPRITQLRKKENFWDFFPMNISEISVSSAQFQADSWKSLLHINLHWLPIQNTMTLYNFALKQCHMHLRFSFFRIWSITIRSRENHVFPRLCPRITQLRKKENFWDFFPNEYIGNIC